MNDNPGMDLWTAPVLDVRSDLARERADLLRFVRELTAEEWLAATRVPGWTVKDFALHILEDDLGWLSRSRDGDLSGRLDMSDGAFIDALNRKNDEWVRAARQLSRPVVTALLEWAGNQMDEHYASQSLTSEGRVVWASDKPVPNWFDIAQDLTERWVHQMQMREAVGRVENFRDDYLPTIMRTFVWAIPHQYRAEAPTGTRVLIDLGQDNRWSLTRARLGWELRTVEPAVAHEAQVTATPDGGWRWLTGATLTPHKVTFDGPPALCEPLLEVRAVLV